MSENEIVINIENNSQEKCIINIENIKFQKMLFLFNAINDGWSIKKKNDSYIFKKNHGNRKEIFLDNYLHTFVKGNFDINKILS